MAGEAIRGGDRSVPSDARDMYVHGGEEGHARCEVMVSRADGDVPELLGCPGPVQSLIDCSFGSVGASQAGQSGADRREGEVRKGRRA